MANERLRVVKPFNTVNRRFDAGDEIGAAELEAMQHHDHLDAKAHVASLVERGFLALAVEPPAIPADAPPAV